MSVVRLISILLGGAGFMLIGFTAGWLPALGVFLCLWSYGMQSALHKEAA